MATTSGSINADTAGSLPSALGDGSALTRRSSLLWMAAACTLVGSSGVLRSLQNQQLERERKLFQPCPFDLEAIPDQIGEWVIKPGSELRLDDKTVQITGSTDHLVRNYVDSLTGVQFSLLLLYGPAEPVLPHTPDVCYPATGYALDGSIGQVGVPYGDGKVAQFRTASYIRPGNLITDRARVYYAFRHDGQWSPSVGAGMKFHRSNPGIFKVQLHRPLMQGEQPTKNEPMEKFLALLLPEIERRITQGKSTPVASRPASSSVQS